MRTRRPKHTPVAQMSNADLGLYIHLMGFMAQGRPEGHPYERLLMIAIAEASTRMNFGSDLDVHHPDCTCEECGVERGWWEPSFEDIGPFDD